MAVASDVSGREAESAAGEGAAAMEQATGGRPPAGGAPAPRRRPWLTTAREGGFTLIELLVVIGIIVVLIGLATVSLGTFRDKAKKAAAVSAIGSLKIALSAYHSLMKKYPGAGLASPQDNPELLFRALYTGDPRKGGSTENHIQDWAPSDIAVWNGSYQEGGIEAIYDRANEAQLDMSQQTITPLVLLDPWGRPYHYVEWDSHIRQNRQLPGGQLRAKGDLPYFIWSDGPNGINDWGKEDDVTSWGG